MVPRRKACCSEPCATFSLSSSSIHRDEPTTRSCRSQIHEHRSGRNGREARQESPCCRLQIHVFLTGRLRMQTSCRRVVAVCLHHAGAKKAVLESCGVGGSRSPCRSKYTSLVFPRKLYAKVSGPLTCLPYRKALRLWGKGLVPASLMILRRVQYLTIIASGRTRSSILT